MTYTSLHTPAVKLRNPLILLLTISFFLQTKKRKNNNPEIFYMGCNLTNVYVNKHQGCHRVAIYYIRYISIWKRVDQFIFKDSIISTSNQAHIAF